MQRTSSKARRCGSSPPTGTQASVPPIGTSTLRSKLRVASTPVPCRNRERLRPRGTPEIEVGHARRRDRRVLHGFGEAHHVPEIDRVAVLHDRPQIAADHVVRVGALDGRPAHDRAVCAAGEGEQERVDCVVLLERHGHGGRRLNRNVRAVRRRRLVGDRVDPTVPAARALRTQQEVVGLDDDVTGRRAVVVAPARRRARCS